MTEATVHSYTGKIEFSRQSEYQKEVRIKICLHASSSDCVLSDDTFTITVTKCTSTVAGNANIFLPTDLS